MFGNYVVPCSIAQDGISISVEQQGGSLFYTRECLDQKVEKTLLANQGQLLVNPVEPLNQPTAITPYLLVEFERGIVVGPETKERMFVTFPVEIAAYVSLNKNSQLLDVFSLVKQKFTLYGDPRNGVICKYWRSGIYAEIPSLNALQEGVIELTVSNKNSDWIEVTKAVFNAYGMKIYYSSNLVAMRSKMNLRDKSIAVTSFDDSPLDSTLRKSLEVYTARKILVDTTEFMMEYGL